MGRSSREQAALNRARIVSTASELFRAKGVEQVSIADVMKAAGMTQGGFYKHFDTKDALVLEAMAEAFAQSALAWQGTAGRHTAAAGSGLHKVMKFYFKPKALAHSCPLLAYAQRAAHCPPEAAQAKAYAEGAKGLFDTFAASASAAGKAEEQARLLFAAMVGAKLLAVATGDSDWAKPFQAVALDAVSAPPPRT